MYFEAYCKLTVIYANIEKNEFGLVYYENNYIKTENRC